MSEFPSCTKMTDLTTVYEKGSRSCKENYHPVNALLSLTQVFGRCLYKQISPYLKHPLDIALNNACLRYWENGRSTLTNEKCLGRF